MNVAGTLVGPGDHVWLPHHCRVLSGMVDRICLLIDRCPEAEAIARRFRKVEVRTWENRKPPMGMGRDGVHFEEGAMRMALWDWCVQSDPQWVVLTDADETPTPDLAWMLIDGCDDDLDVGYMDWVNLIHDAGHAIGGKSAWSYQAAGSNKKGVLCRYRKGREYRYRTHATRHCRMEPSPLSPFATVFDATHRLIGPKLIHHRWAAWDRWNASEQSNLPYFQPWPPDDAEVVDVPREWHHVWDADLLIDSLPDPIAVVGNGPMCGTGKQIDAARTVIRLNNWRTEGYEPHVGTRTDVWVTNTWETCEMRPWVGPMLTVTTDHCQYDRNSRWLGAYPHMHIPCWSWTDACREIKPLNPSTGLVLLHRLAQTEKRVEAYGFSGLSGGWYWNPEHVHDHGLESAALAGLAGRINFH